MSFQPAIAIHPGEFLKDELDYLGVSQKWLADRTGYSEKQISQILNGNAIISCDLAILLENALGVSAETWNNFTKNYLEDNSRLEMLKRAKEEAAQYREDILGIYNILHTYNLADKVNSLIDKTLCIWKFFGVNSIGAIRTTLPIAFRKYSGQINKYAVAVWLRIGEIKAQKALESISDFDKEKLRKSIPLLLDVILSERKTFIEDITKILSDCGVVLITTKYINKTRTSGAVRWVGQHPIIQLSDQGKTDDKIWFSFFHEIGHILRHGKKDQFISFDNAKNENDAKEREADAFAAETLLPTCKYDIFVKYGDFSQNAIETFAKENRILPSILLGRLEHDKKLKYGSFKTLHNKITLQ